MNPNPFTKLTIQSYIGGIRTPEDAYTEVEQRLTIAASGKVWFSARTPTAVAQGRSRRLAIDADAAARIIARAVALGSSHPDVPLSCDGGWWTLTLSGGDEATLTCSGDLYVSAGSDALMLSALIRESVPIDDLWALDGGVEKPSNVILFPEYEALKTRVEGLRASLTALVLERDELLHIICKNLETKYLLLLGALEYKAFSAECAYLRLKRKLEMVQAKRNRREKVILGEIDDALDAEFAEFKAKLEERMDKINDAITISKGKKLTDKEVVEFKRLYRRIVKALHPDLHPGLSDAQMRLFLNAVDAYKAGDLPALRIIDEMTTDFVPPADEQDATLTLVREEERLEGMLKELRESIDSVKGEFPYTARALLNDEKQVEARKAELADIVRQYEDASRAVSESIERLVKGGA